MSRTTQLKYFLKRGALVAAANWQVVVIQFVSDALFKTMLAVPVVGGAFLIVGLIVLLVANWRNNRRQTQEVGTTSVALAFAMGLLGGLSRKR